MTRITALYRRGALIFSANYTQQGAPADSDTSNVVNRDGRKFRLRVAYDTTLPTLRSAVVVDDMCMHHRDGRGRSSCSFGSVRASATVCRLTASAGCGHGWAATGEPSGSRRRGTPVYSSQPREEEDRVSGGWAGACLRCSNGRISG